MSPEFSIGTPASILLSQTAFVTPRATVRIVLGTFVAEKGGIGSQAPVEPATAYSAGGSSNDLFAVGSDTVVRSDLLFYNFNTPFFGGGCVMFSCPNDSTLFGVARELGVSWLGDGEAASSGAAHQPTVANFPTLLQSQMLYRLYFAQQFLFVWSPIRFVEESFGRLNFRNY